MKKNNYYVIGGQYEPYCYGGCPTLTGAKRLATKCEEYWDNWHGFHKPEIYKAEDTYTKIACGMVTHPDGVEIRLPIDGAKPVANDRNLQGRS